MIGAIILACEKHLDDIRVNPNAVTEIDDAALFTKAVRDLFKGTADKSVSAFAGPYAHYLMLGSTHRPPGQYLDVFDGDYNSTFNGIYNGVIRHSEEVLQITSKEGTKNEVRHALATIISVMGFAKLTDTYGEIPYTEGGKGKSEGIIKPRYDTQESIYKSLIERLGKSIEVLKTAKPSQAYPNSDPIFDNDLSKWVRFANSVRLRLAMRIRYANVELSKTTVTQCLAEPLMELMEHDAAMIETEGNGNPWYNIRTGFPRVRMSNFLIDKLQKTADPRLAVFVARDKDGKYNGITNGLMDIPFGTSGYDDKSDMGLALASKDSKQYLMNAAETWLLRAEAALVYDNDEGKAKEYFRKGIETSLKQWKIDTSAINAFMESPVAQLDGENKEEQIGNQMYLALIPNYFESWTYIRRTGYPVIPVRTSEDLSKGATNGIMPKRFKYSSFELGANEANVNEAIKRQGPNLIDTPVWWDKNE